MIPSDVANAMRLLLPDQTKLTANLPQNQPVVSAQRVTDALSDLVPGQRVMAEIQAMLPNGTYRAVIAQRDITLALPFSAKAGDSLELEVVDNDGELALAVVAKGSSGDTSGQPTESVPTRLSQTGQLIGKLMEGIDQPGKRAAPAPLNGNQPVVDRFPEQAETLAPILKEALSKSGVFYEAHQARWVAGELPTAALRQEPQGKTLPTVMASVMNSPPPAPAGVLLNLPQELPATTPLPTFLTPTPNSEPQATSGEQSADALRPVEQDKSPAILAANTNTPPEERLTDASQADSRLPTLPTTAHGQQTTQGAPSGNPIPRDLTPIVQQQLDALATQNYVWQGQLWPGQKMWWEISEDPDHKRSTDGENATHWQTRLKLSLPALGGIDAVLRLQPGGKVDISMTSDSASGETRLRENSALLRDRLESAGLNLTQLLIQHGEVAE